MVMGLKLGQQDIRQIAADVGGTCAPDSRVNSKQSDVGNLWSNLFSDITRDPVFSFAFWRDFLASSL